MTYAFKGQKELKTNWPITSGLTAGTTKQAGRIMNLEAQDGSTVLRRNKVGIK